MNGDNRVALMFPCPACQTTLTLYQAQANGPCPHCHTPIVAHLNVQIEELELMDSNAPMLDLPESEPPTDNKFERRRFRPSGSRYGSPQSQIYRLPHRDSTS